MYCDSNKVVGVFYINYVVNINYNECNVIIIE